MTPAPDSIPKLMRAAVARAFGPPEVLEIREMPRPEPGPEQLLVRVLAAGVNPVDAGNRSDGSWAGIRAPFVVGSDASGVVEKTGDGTFAAGDEVFYFSPFLHWQNGSCAEYQVIDADLVSPRPRSLSHLQSAALPLACGTAYELVVRRLVLGEGELVLIYGAAGGVGGYAVQLAKLTGAVVLAVASDHHAEYLKTLGADYVIDYRSTEVTTAAADLVGEVDAVIDLVGGDAPASALEILRHHGRLASAVGLSGDLGLAVDKNQVLHGVLVSPDGARLRALAALVDAGALLPPPLEVYSLGEIAHAHTRVQQGHGRTKVVIDLGSRQER
jgi:NADPH:quinone reductase